MADARLRPGCRADAARRCWSLAWLCAAGALLAFPMAGAAGIYRWVDADGRVHYGDQPPAGTRVQSLAPAPPPGTRADAPASPSLEAYVREIDARNAERSREEERQRQAKQREAARGALCESSRARRLHLERPRQLEIQADGSARRLTEEERQQRIAEVERKIVDACVSQP